MKRILSLLMLIAALGLGACTTVPTSSAGAPLFVNLISDEPHRATMGIGFGAKQMERGHPLTLFLNDRAVVLASSANTARFPQQQKMLAELLAQGATVLVCPMCMQQYGVKQADLLPGLKMGTPEITGGALFKPNSRTMTW